MKNNKQIQRERDDKIIQFINHFQCARTDTIHELFFIKEDGTHTALRIAQDRLKKLSQDDTTGIKKGGRENYTQQYYYYPVGRKPTSQLKHTLLITDFYRELHRMEGVKVYRFYRISQGEFRPEAYVLCTINGKIVEFFLEIELSKKGFDMQKYIECRYKETYKELGLEEMPNLVVVTNTRKLPDSDGINVVKIRTDLSDIDNILKI